MLVDDVIAGTATARVDGDYSGARGYAGWRTDCCWIVRNVAAGEISMIQEVERDLCCKVISIITLKDLIAYLEENLYGWSIWRLCEHTVKNFM